MKKIATEKAPGAIGPYSQGYMANGLVITSGQLPVDPATGEMPDGIAVQAEQSCKNVGAILAAAGIDFANVIKTTCFLADMNDFVPFNEEYSKSFGDIRPARSAVEVAALPKGALVEVEVIAYVG